MAIRGKVKVVKIDTNSRTVIGSDGIPVTITTNVATGTVTDTVAKVDYPFTQPYGKELGLAVNSIVQFEAVTASDGSKVATALDPVERGTIESIEYVGGTGILIDKAGNKLNFEQPYGQELGLAKDVIVRFATVTVNGMAMATSLRLPA